MDTEMLAPRSGETVELIAFSVLVAQCCVPCLRMVLPSEPLNFSLELKREIGKIRQMAAPRSQTRTAITCDKDRQICVTDKERVQQGVVCNKDRQIASQTRRELLCDKDRCTCVTDKEGATVRQGQIYCVTDKERASVRQGQRYCLVPPFHRYAALAFQCS